MLWPKRDGELMRLLTVTHTQRWHAHRRSAGTGQVYQGRYESFPIQRDEHLLAVCRYVERNAVRAKLVKSAARWRWGSAGVRAGTEAPDWLLAPDDWPATPPPDWAAWVDRAETAAELEALRQCVE